PPGRRPGSGHGGPLLPGRQGQDPDEGGPDYRRRLADPGRFRHGHGGVDMAGRIEGRVALVMEYDGANYAGWQLQHNADTVQARVEKALGHLFGCPVSVRAASR